MRCSNASFAVPDENIQYKDAEISSAAAWDTYRLTRKKTASRDCVTFKDDAILTFQPASF